MPTYTVHAPKPRKGEAVSDPERFVFVRDGFYWWAFLLGPVWMIAHALWLALLGYVLVNVAISGALSLVGAGAALRLIVMLAFALLVGFEASSLRRFGLRKWNQVGIVVGQDAEDAERRFYASWAGSVPSVTLRAKSPTPSSPVLRGPPQGSHVIGLFPEPESSR